MNRFMSVFSQILQLFSRLECEQAVKETKAERHARGFSSWSQFVAMLFCQLGRAKSLREICGGLACCEGKLSHLGITVPLRSTLAYAERTPTVEAVPAGLLPPARALPRRGEKTTPVPVQEHVAEPGRLRHRSLRHAL